METIRHLSMKAALVIFVLFLAGCAASSTVEKRRQEKFSAYDSLSADEKAMVDAGQIKVGMSADAVYIAWGKPSEILESEDAGGHVTRWLYYGSVLQENRYWTYREGVGSHRGQRYLERYLASDYTPRDYVRSEIVFKTGRVASWRMLPRPTE